MSLVSFGPGMAMGMMALMVLMLLTEARRDGTAKIWLGAQTPHLLCGKA
jgi:hypothetical protein